MRQFKNKILQQPVVAITNTVSSDYARFFIILSSGKEFFEFFRTIRNSTKNGNEEEKSLQNTEATCTVDDEQLCYEKEEYIFSPVKMNALFTMRIRGSVVYSTTPVITRDKK